MSPLCLIPRERYRVGAIPHVTHHGLIFHINLIEAHVRSYFPQKPWCSTSRRLSPPERYQSHRRIDTLEGSHAIRWRVDTTYIYTSAFTLRISCDPRSQCVKSRSSIVSDHGRCNFLHQSTIYYESAVNHTYST